MYPSLTLQKYFTKKSEKFSESDILKMSEFKKPQYSFAKK
jgi:hypothetical protein